MRTHTTKWLGFFFVAAACALAQQNNPPQRTMTARKDTTAASDSKAPAGMPSTPSAALEQYRMMWQKMTPAQQQAIIRAGGPSPEQYERMLTQATGNAGNKETPGASAHAAPESGRQGDSGAFDALTKSMQDLNAVRDGNLSLVQKEACAPELASRIADLKAKLRNDEFQLNGTEVPSAAAPAAAAPAADAHPAGKPNASDPLAVANDWFKHPADAKAPAAPQESTSRTRESSQLDAVLAGAQPSAPAERRADAKSPETTQNKQMIEADMARVKAELEQLSGACASAKQ